MPGPTPKDPTLRSRRNKTTTAAKLSVVSDDASADLAERHPLPDRVDDEGNVRPWHPMAQELWREVWSSPMATEYLDADVPGLYVLANLTDGYWRGVEQGKAMTELAKELRLQRVDYGLTPIARRRLQWEVEKAEEAKDKGRRRKVQSSDRSAKRPATDPRNLLTGE